MDLVATVSAVASSAAVAVAVAVLAFDRRERARAQVRQVAVWGEAVGSQADHVRINVHVRNASDLAVYDLAVVYRQPEDDPSRAAKSVAHRIYLVPPHGEEDLVLEMAGPITGFYPRPLTHYLTDASGRRWHRDAAGRLRLAGFDDGPLPPVMYRRRWWERKSPRP